jgi:hypothetical protein
VLATLVLILSVLWFLADGLGRSRGILALMVGYAVALAIVVVSVRSPTERRRTVLAIFGTSTLWCVLWGCASALLGLAGHFEYPFLLLVPPLCALASGAAFGLVACVMADDGLARIRVGLLVGLVGGLVPALVVLAALVLGARGDDFGLVILGTLAFLPAGALTGALTSTAIKWRLNSQHRARR